MDLSKYGLIGGGTVGSSDLMKSSLRSRTETPINIMMQVLLNGLLLLPPSETSMLVFIQLRLLFDARSINSSSDVALASYLQIQIRF